MKLENEKEKFDMKKEFISKDLNELFKLLVKFFVMMVLFGYIGYVYSKDNNISISHGIIFGSIFPLGIAILNSNNYNSIFTYIIYTIAYLIIVDYIPTFIGIIVLFTIILVFIGKFIYIEKKDRTEEILEYYNSKKSNNTITTSNNESATKEIIENYSTKRPNERLNDYDDERFSNYEEEYECEICFKKISEEEFELYDCMCEECFMEVHIDEDGHFHDDKYFNL